MRIVSLPQRHPKIQLQMARMRARKCVILHTTRRIIQPFSIIMLLYWTHTHLLNNNNNNARVCIVRTLSRGKPVRVL